MRPPILRMLLAAICFCASAFLNASAQSTLTVPGDHLTIQAAIDAASPGDTVIVAAGTYAEELNTNKAVTIQGANAGIAAGNTPGVRGAETILDGGMIVSAAATIDGLNIKNGRSSGSVKVGVAVATSGVTVINCIIEDVLAPAQSDGISTQPTNNNLTVSNSTIRNNWRGIYLNPGDGHTFTGNLIDANNGVGVGIGSDGQSNLTITGNTISNNSVEGWGASAVGTGVVANGNSFLNNGVSVAHYGGQPIDATENYWGTPGGAGTAVSGDVAAVPYYTDAGLTNLYAPVNNTTQSTGHATIQEAIDAAFPGDTIEVDDGTYNENLNVNKAVTLVSINGKAAVTIQGSAAQAAALGGGNVATICISSSDVSIGTSGTDGFTVIGYDVSTPAIEHAAIYIKPGATTGLAIMGNSIVADGEGGLLGQYGLPQEIEVAHNVFSGKTYVGTSVGGTSAVQFTTPNVPRSMVYFSGNCTSISFHDNIVGGSVGAVIGSGPDTYYNTGATIDCNAATSLANGAVIADNTFTIPSWAALRARGPFSTVTGNTFDSSGAGGLVVGTFYSNTGNDVYSGNVYISGAGEMSLVGDGTSDATFAGNYADYQVVQVETPFGTSLRVSGGDRVVYLGAQQTITFDDQTLTVASLSVPTVRMVPAVHASIQAAIDAATAGDIIEIAAGAYTENLSVAKALTLTGPNAGIDAVTGSRSAEAEIAGQLTITADDVAIAGLSLSNPSGTVGIYAKRCSGLTVENNIIHDINSAATGSASGVYVLGDNSSTGAIPIQDFTITGNHIHAIGSLATTVSVKGIYFGDSNGISTVSNVLVQGNKVENVTTTRGSYGIMLNYGVNASGTVDDVQIKDNIVTNLEGLWVHGIGLETDTTNTVVSGNDLSDLRDNKTPSDAVGIFFEGNPSGDTVELSRNILRSSMGWGVAIHPNDLSTHGYTVDAGANYWDSPDGPSGEASGAGTPVAPGVATSSFYSDEAMTDLKSVETWVDDDFTAATPGFGLDHFATLQDAIPSTLPGGTVNIADGTYLEAGHILIDKDLTVIGAGAASVTLKPDHATSGGSYAQENGWLAVEPGATLNLSGVTLDGTDLGGVQQSIKMAIISRGTLVLEDCAVQNIASAQYLGWGVCILAGSDSVIRRCDFSNIQRIGVHIRGHVAEPTPSALVEDCTFTGKGNGDWVEYGVEFGGGGSGTVSGCSFSNYTGVALSDGSASAGILATDYYGNGTDATVTGCTISACSTGIMVGYATTDTTVLDATNNSITGCDDGMSTTPNADVTASPNYWGAADGPSGEGPGSGDSVGEDISYSPWWEDAAMTILAYDNGDFGSDHTVGPGEVLEIPLMLTISGGTFLVDGGTVDAGELDLADGAILKVVDGELIVGGSVLSGSFTFFNSFGSVNFNDDVSIEASAEGLILVSDVHVVDGATVSVSGNLVIDGCVVDSPGSFDLVIDAGAQFTMARTVFTNGSIVTSADDTSIYDNRFVNSTIEVTTGTTGAKVYHNLTDDLAWLTDSGSATVKTVDGWDNLLDTDAGSTQNNMILNLGLGTLTDPGSDRTLDALGNAWVQGTDSFTADIDLSALSQKVSAAEMLLGYSTDYLGASNLTVGANWEDPPIVEQADTSTVIGMIDAALGLSFDFTDPVGTDSDQTLASVDLTAQGLEGETVFFHRVKLASDTFGGETRLTAGGASPSYLAPFTANSGTITVDSSAPTIDVASSNGTQVQASASGPVDVLDPEGNPVPSITFRNGNPVELTFTATDAGPAGIDVTDDDGTGLGDDLTLVATNGSTTLSSWTATATEDGSGVVTFTVTLDIPATATNGVYTVTASVLDRSGNESATADLGDFEIANELAVEVELQAFAGGTRNVTFVATDASGSVLATYADVPVVFTGSTGSVSLADVPSGTVGLSAKTAWSLRSKVAVALTGPGTGTADLTGADLLPGGDLNGDNVVNTLDYSILRFYWLETDPTADITGNSGVGLDDYGPLQANFYSAGDDL